MGIDWQALFGDLTVVQALLWIAALVALIFLIVKGWPVVRGLVKLVDTLSTLPDDIASIKKNLAEVRHEVLPNQGGSMRDAVDTLNLRVQKAEAKLDNDHEKIADLTEAINRRTPEGEQP